MTLEQNKQAAMEFFRRFDADDIDGAIAEGDKVALEVVSRGELVGGRLYENEYHVLVTLRDGRIVAAREYNDTQHAHDVRFAP